MGARCIDKFILEPLFIASTKRERVVFGCALYWRAYGSLYKSLIEFVFYNK